MNEESPSRSRVLELREERHALAEGHAFLEEKSLLLAAEIVRQLGLCDRLRAAADAAAARALATLAAALATHGLEELSVLPVPAPAAARLACERRSVVGVTVIDASLGQDVVAPAARAWGSPEAREARAAFGELLAAATPLGAVQGNLERLAAEYRRTIRRERALADVLIPEMDQHLAALEARLEDIEREDAIAVRLGTREDTPC